MTLLRLTRVDAGHLQKFMGLSARQLGAVEFQEREWDSRDRPDTTIPDTEILIIGGDEPRVRLIFDSPKETTNATQTTARRIQV